MQSTRGYGLLEKILSYYRQTVALKLIKNRVRRETILDIGCGFFPTFLIRSNFKNKYGIDQYLVDSLVIKNKYQIQLNKMNISNEISLPYKDDYFDVVAMLAVIEHIEGEKLKLIIQEIHRVLSKNGILVITTPSEKINKLMKTLANFGLLSSVEINDHKTLFSLKKLRTFFDKYSKLSVIKSGYFQLCANIYLIAQKNEN